MKADIHPKYTQITVTCSCGNSFITSSTLGKDLNVELCNECHPFYTGKQKMMDTTGRVERFKGRFGSFSLNKDKAAEEDQKPD
jgi:large subunit ribosomal protein L31